MNAPTVLIVPGIAGSELHVAPDQWPHPIVGVWVSPTLLLAGAWRALELAPDGVSPASLLLPRLIGLGPLRDYYGILLEELTMAGFRVTWPHLDWRQSIALCADRLAATILAQAVNGPVALVCHSRGGLVARHALAALKTAGRLDAVGICVGLGVPHQGSWTAVQFLGGWDPTMASLAWLLSVIPGPLALGETGISLIRVARTWPSPYELLPKPGATWTDTQSTGRAYNIAEWAYPQAPISPAWLNAAFERWQSQPAIDPAVRWIDVVGVGYATPSDITSAPVGTRGAIRNDAQGDGIVAEESASQPGRPAIRVNVAHGAMPYTGRAIEAVVQSLRGQV